MTQEHLIELAKNNNFKFNDKTIETNIRLGYLMGLRDVALKLFGSDSIAFKVVTARASELLDRLC